MTDERGWGGGGFGRLPGVGEPDRAQEGKLGLAAMGWAMAITKGLVKGRMSAGRGKVGSFVERRLGDINRGLTEWQRLAHPF